MTSKKVNPVIFRLNTTKNWDSLKCSQNYPYFLKKELHLNSVAKHKLNQFNIKVLNQINYHYKDKFIINLFIYKYKHKIKKKLLWRKNIYKTYKFRKLLATKTLDSNNVLYKKAKLKFYQKKKGKQFNYAKRLFLNIVKKKKNRLFRQAKQKYLSVNAFKRNWKKKKRNITFKYQWKLRHNTTIPQHFFLQKSKFKKQKLPFLVRKKKAITDQKWSFINWKKNKIKTILFKQPLLQLKNNSLPLIKNQVYSKHLKKKKIDKLNLYFFKFLLYKKKTQSVLNFINHDYSSIKKISTIHFKFNKLKLKKSLQVHFDKPVEINIFNSLKFIKNNVNLLKTGKKIFNEFFWFRNNVRSYKDWIHILNITTYFGKADILSDQISRELGWTKKHKKLGYTIYNLFIRFIFYRRHIKGFRMAISGKINARPRASTFYLGSGSMPLQTINSNISHSASYTERNKFGAFSIKVWIFYS